MTAQPETFLCVYVDYSNLGQRGGTWGAALFLEAEERPALLVGGPLVGTGSEAAALEAAVTWLDKHLVNWKKKQSSTVMRKQQ